MFGQVVIGPPGSGKSTYCKGMKEFLTSLGRNVALVNLDPANDDVPYKYDLDIKDLINLSDVVDKLHLGPNGALLYCMEYVESNVEWLLSKLGDLRSKYSYVLFDFPGQVELYTHNNCVKNILKRLLDVGGHRLCTVHLVDAHYASDPSKFIAVLLTSLASMIQLETPHVNVLSKMDLMTKYGNTAFSVDFYTEVLDLKYLLDCIQDDPFLKKFKDLNAGICDVVESYGLVSFFPLNVQDKKTMVNVLREADKANGYCFREMEDRQLLNFMYPTSPTTKTPANSNNPKT